ncbi:MAG TPA: hypothetical protein VEB42_08460 [Chitinophagaceae bacterium]|nr:hypothetical protein [Chitinophagaceae bacterium]
MKRMNAWLIGVTLAALATTMHGCKKDDKPASEINEKPGHIPGMGEQQGELQGEQFKLPRGVSLVSGITGAEYGPATPGVCVFDGVGINVMVKIELQRDSIGGPMTVEFPAGLVITSASEGFQHGLLVEKVLVPLPPRDPGADAPRCNVTLLMACLNHSRNPSESDVNYKFGPVTNSPLIKDLLQRLAGKKILFSQYPPNDPDWSLNAEFIQDAVWNLTEYDGLTKDDLRHIAELPNK